MLDCVTSLFFFLFASETLQIDVNTCVPAKEVDDVSSNNGGRLGESEGINGMFVDFNVPGSKQNSSIVLLCELLRNKSQFVSQL